MRDRLLCAENRGQCFRRGMLSASRNIAISKISDLGGRIRDTFPAESRDQLFESFFQCSAENFLVRVQESGGENGTASPPGSGPSAIRRKLKSQVCSRSERRANSSTARIPFENGAQVRRSFRFPASSAKPERRQFLHLAWICTAMFRAGSAWSQVSMSAASSQRREFPPPGRKPSAFCNFRKVFTRTAERCESVGIGK